MILYKIKNSVTGKFSDGRLSYRWNRISGKQVMGIDFSRTGKIFTKSELKSHLDYIFISNHRDVARFGNPYKDCQVECFELTKTEKTLDIEEEVKIREMDLVIQKLIN